VLLGIVGAKTGNEQIHYVPFIEDELIAVSSPSLVGKSQMTLKELVKLPMVLREEGSGRGGKPRDFSKAKGFSRWRQNRRHLRFNRCGKQAVKAGLGVAILSKFSVADELKHKILHEIKFTDIEMRRKFFIVTHKKRTLPRLYDAFFKHVVAEAKTAI